MSVQTPSDVTVNKTIQSHICVKSCHVTLPSQSTWFFGFSTNAHAQLSIRWWWWWWGQGAISIYDGGVKEMLQKLEFFALKVKSKTLPLLLLISNAHVFWERSETHPIPSFNDLHCGWQLRSVQRFLQMQKHELHLASNLQKDPTSVSKHRVNTLFPQMCAENVPLKALKRRSAMTLLHSKHGTSWYHTGAVFCSKLKSVKASLWNLRPQISVDISDRCILIFLDPLQLHPGFLSWPMAKPQSHHKPLTCAFS